MVVAHARTTTRVAVKTTATLMFMIVTKKVQRWPCRNDDKGGGENGGNVDVDDNDGDDHDVVIHFDCSKLVVGKERKLKDIER